VEVASLSPRFLACFCRRGLGAAWARPGRGLGAGGRGRAVTVGGRRCAATALRCSVLRPRGRTRFAHCVRCARTAATSQMTMRAARAAARPALLGAAPWPPVPARPRPGRTARVFDDHSHHQGGERWAVRGGGSLGSGEERRAGVGARSAHREL